MSCLLLVDDEEEGASQPEGGVELPRGDVVGELQAGHPPEGIFRTCEDSFSSSQGCTCTSPLGQLPLDAIGVRDQVASPHP